MPIVTHTRTELEDDVIQSAIDYVQRAVENGLYRDRERYLQELQESVERLLADDDGRWEPTDNSEAVNS